MRGGVRGFLTGAGVLVALQVAVREGSSSRIGALFLYPSRWAQSFMSPDVPAFRRKK